MRTEESQGKLANKHGEKNRDAFAAVLLSHGFEDIGPLLCEPARVNVLDEFEKRRLSTFGQPIRVFAADVPIGYSVLGTKFDAHFLMRAENWPEPMALMVRTQESGGSAHERFEYLYANLNERLPCRSLIALSLTPSPCFKPPMIQAVYARAESWVPRSAGRIAKIFRGLDDFRRWLSDYAPCPPIPQTEMFT